MIFLSLLFFLLIGLIGVDVLMSPLAFLASFQIPQWSIALSALALLTWLLKD